MIRLTEKARLECDEEGCEESHRVSLVLLSAGMFRPDFPPSAMRLGWACMIDRDNPMTPYRGRCPTHAKTQSRIVQLDGPGRFHFGS